MTLESSMAEIESPALSARMNVVSSERAFYRAAEVEPAIQDIVRCSYESRDATRTLINRIRRLAAEEPDPNYENPNDTALALYLWIVSSIDLENASAAEYVLHSPNCWYAQKLARRVVASGARAEETKDIQVGTPPPGTQLH